MTSISSLLAFPIVYAWLLAMLLFSLAFPFIVFAAFLHLRGIRRELARLNNTLEARAGTV